jgi:alpha-L-fucosidase
MNRRTLIKHLGLSLPALLIGRHASASGFFEGLNPAYFKNGPFKPTWESLQNYKVPAWYSNAKFGLWAHWGPQCQPEAGDWYARGMYQEGSNQYKKHIEKYGHPSKFGFKDVIMNGKPKNGILKNSLHCIKR